MNEDRRLRHGDFPVQKLVLAWLAVCAILLLTNATRLVTGRFPDPDDALRLVQVRDLLGGQGWFDTTQYRIDPPSGTTMHWSRLVDLPLLLIVTALEPLVGQANAERAALVMVPFLTFGVAAAAVGRLAWRLLGARVAVFAVLACGFLPSLLFQFQPLRIDHHGWQIASLAIALWAICRRRPRAGGSIAGLSMALGISISLELLPLAAAFASVLFWRWWLNSDDRFWLVAYMQALSIGLIATYLATRGLSFEAYCDSVSPAHLTFFVVAGCGTWAIGRMVKLTGFGLASLFALVGILALGFFALVAPTCLASPFATLDPMVERYWYRLVLEGQPLWKQPASTYVPALIQMGAGIGAMVLLMIRSRGWTRRWWSEHLFLLLAAVILGLLVARSLAFAALIAAIPLGWLAVTLLDRLRSQGRPVYSFSIAAMMVLLLAPMSLVLAARSFMPAPEVAVQGAQNSSCDIYENAQRLDQLGSETIFAPLDMGPAVLLDTKHAVVATGHHRAADAMSDLIRAFTSSADEARVLLAAHAVDYVALCTDMNEIRLYTTISNDGFAARLASGEVPRWLRPIDVGGPAAFAVYRVID